MRAEDEAVDDVVRPPAHVGLQTAPDGEFRRACWQAVRYVPIEQLAPSPTCGFSYAVEGDALTHDDHQRAQLELVVQAAAEVRG